MYTHDRPVGLARRSAILSTRAAALGLVLAVTSLGASAQVATAPYAVSVFANSPAGTSQPDSIVTWHDSVIVGFENGVAKDGSDGKSSTIVQFDSRGNVVRSFSVLGHNDGLRVIGDDQLWAMQNEDANPNLVIINLDSGNQTEYALASVNGGGGFDDIVVLDGSVYFTASNPPNSPNLAPAVVRATLVGSSLKLDPVVLGNATARDVTTGQLVTLNLQDPDSMTTDPKGELVFVSQADAQLLFVRHVGAPDQKVRVLPLSSPVAGPGATTFTIDDTAFAPRHSKALLVTDIKGNAIYTITRGPSGFERGQPYSASDSYGIVGTLDLKSGVVTPIVTGLISARGLTFVRGEERRED